MTFIPQRCFLINLDRRQDRYKEWLEQRPEPWPFAEVERYRAIDGKLVPTPTQWRNGQGAWGCYRSHLNILEKCLMEEVTSYVVFEDDAAFCEDFVELYQAYVRNLPKDWGLAYLGGQHLGASAHPPVQVAPGVFRPYNVNRTHAFMVRGKENMRILYRHLTWNQWVMAHHHIDHHLGRLVQRDYVEKHEAAKIEKEKLPTYTPEKWLCGQLPSRSNICGKKFDTVRFFNNAVDVAETQTAPFFAVLGPHRSGTSCVAMLLYHLGVHLGNELGGYEATGGGEAVGLASICETAMKFPSMELAIERQDLVKRLRTWTNQRRTEAKALSTVAGGKYPHLSAMGPELLDAVGEGLCLICVDRPLEKSIDSLIRRSAKNPAAWHSATPDKCKKLQTFLHQKREEFILANEDLPVLRIDYEQLLKDPAGEIDRLVTFLGIEPTSEQYLAAINHVKPELDGSVVS